MFVHLGLVLAGLASGLDRASPIPAIAVSIPVCLSTCINMQVLYFPSPLVSVSGDPAYVYAH